MLQPEFTDNLFSIPMHSIQRVVIVIAHIIFHFQIAIVA